MDNGPDFWITPPTYPTYRSARELGQAISQVTGAGTPSVLHAMSAGVAPNVRRALRLPSE